MVCDPSNAPVKSLKGARVVHILCVYEQGMLWQCADVQAHLSPHCSPIGRLRLTEVFNGVRIMKVIYNNEDVHECSRIIAYYGSEGRAHMSRRMSKTSEDSDQPGHPPSLIRIFAVHSMTSSGPKLSSRGQRRLWSDWAHAQADLNLRWVHMSFCWFCHEAAHICLVQTGIKADSKSA